MSEFLDEALAQTKDQQTKKSLAEAKRANEDRLKALDHGLVAGLGFGLDKFKAMSPCLPLMRGGTSLSWRVFALRDVAPDRLQRACVCGGDNQKRSRLEVSWANRKAVLHAASDMGPINRPSQYFLFTQEHIRGYMWFDLPHRRHDNTKKALQRTLKVAKWERTIVQNVCVGPWDTAGHFRPLQEAAREYFSNMTCDDSLFVMLYPRICDELGEYATAADYGTASHRQYVWDMLPQLPCFNHMGSKSMANRWFQLQKKILATRCYDSCILLAILYVGLTLGWWRCISETSLVVNGPDSAGQRRRAPCSGGLAGARISATASGRSLAGQTATAGGRAAGEANGVLQRRRPECQEGRLRKLTALGRWDLGEEGSPCDGLSAGLVERPLGRGAWQGDRADENFARWGGSGCTSSWGPCIAWLASRTW